VPRQRQTTSIMAATRHSTPQIGRDSLTPQPRISATPGAPPRYPTLLPPRGSAPDRFPHPARCAAMRVVVYSHGGRPHRVPASRSISLSLALTPCHEPVPAAARIIKNARASSFRAASLGQSSTLALEEPACNSGIRCGTCATTSFSPCNSGSRAE
jgi:hypothetical protein